MLFPLQLNVCIKNILFYVELLMHFVLKFKAINVETKLTKLNPKLQ